MALDLSSLDQPRTQTVVLSGALAGFEIHLRHRTIRERERFRGKLFRDGIMRSTANGDDINPGRMIDFIRIYTQEVVIGWEVPERFRSAEAKDQNPPYSPEELAKILDVSPESLSQISKAANEEASFFSPNGDGSHG